MSCFLSYPSQQEAALQIDYIPYLDFMAGEVSSALYKTVYLYLQDTHIIKVLYSQVGVRPNLLRLLLSDPVLWAKVFFGPCTPYQYRLTGPGKWAGARQAILTQWERVVRPFRTRAVPEPERRSFFCSAWLLLFWGTVITAVLLSKNVFVPVLQGTTQIMDRCKIFLKDPWFTGLPQ